MEPRIPNRSKVFLESVHSVPPVFRDLTKSTIRAVEGTLVTLESDPNVTEPTTFQWYYGSKSMLKEVPLKGQTNQTLSFVVSQKAVSGHFRCRAETQSGHVFLSKWFLVLIEATKPKPRSIKFRAGRSSSTRY
jgi:hypothetical protein